MRAYGLCIINTILTKEYDIIYCYWKEQAYAVVQMCSCLCFEILAVESYTEV